MQKRIEEFLSQRRIALVGATPRKKKWGYRIFCCLRENGYEVHPIHPVAEAVDGVPCVRSLADLPEPVDGVSIVVPPAVGSEVVRECLRLGISRVWFQPGAESRDAIGFCEENGLSVIHRACVLVELGCR